MPPSDVSSSEGESVSRGQLGKLQTAAMPASEIVADEDIGELEFALSEDDGDEIIEADDFVALADEQN